MRFLFIVVFFLPILASCSPPEHAEKKNETRDAERETNSVISTNSETGCRHCHLSKHDRNHNFNCSQCHRGEEKSNEKPIAHEGLVAWPSHPTHMENNCGQCHETKVQNLTLSSHYTLEGSTNQTRRVFGQEKKLANFKQIPEAKLPKNELDLVDDLLRRRCLRCHLFAQGDRYPGVKHGTGCAACHLEIKAGKLTSHIFIRLPGDRQCLKCHYGNRVGFDYYGRFEHDINEEYRTPYTTREEFFRPFGIEYHQLEPDIHQKAGMECIDCHFGSQLMGEDNSKPSLMCKSCHSKDALENNLPENIKKVANGYVYIRRRDQKNMVLPVMKNRAHTSYQDDIACQVCHAQWSFNDTGLHLLRRDSDEYDDFWKLTSQGSFEVEKILTNNLDFDNEEMAAEMTDQLSGKQEKGLWHKGFTMRRWETVALGRDINKTIVVTRPMLDLHLSWIDENEMVHFDSISPESRDKVNLPYVPHTTGSAGIFYRQRIQDFLEKESNKAIPVR